MDLRKFELKVDKDRLLIDFLKYRGISNRKIKELVKNGYVKYLNRSLKLKDKLKENQIIEIYIENENIDYAPIYGDLDIFFENDEFLVVYKKENLTINSANQVSLANHLAYYFKKNNIKSKVRFVNRIDYGTRGLVLVSKSSLIHGFLQNKLNEIIKREYIGVVRGKLEGSGRLEFNFEKGDSFKQVISKNGKKSITEYEVIESNEEYSLVKFNLITGRNHQIRASMNEIGHPLVGDSLYTNEDKESNYYLISYKICAPDFLSGEVFNFELDYRKSLKKYVYENLKNF